MVKNFYAKYNKVPVILIGAFLMGCQPSIQTEKQTDSVSDANNDTDKNLEATVSTEHPNAEPNNSSGQEVDGSTVDETASDNKTIENHTHNNTYINDIPDFTQTDIVGNKTGNGQQYCAPVSVSNSLLWLSGNKIQQSTLIHKLASKPYMNTSLKNGTGTSGVLLGVSKVANEIFGGYNHLEYQGWRKHPSKYSNGIKRPQIEKIKSFITKKSAAWINIGWYKYEANKNEYLRVGGHWMTVVGSTPHQLIIHDPSPRAGKSFANEYVSYSKITNGTLTGQKYGLPTSAKGYFKLDNGMHKKQSVDFAIIDGVVFFSL